MKRYNSQRNLPLKPVRISSKFQKSKSLPNIDICCEIHKTFLIKSALTTSRQNSVKKSCSSSSGSKIFQKTWDKVKTIIHPHSHNTNTRRNSSNVNVSNCTKTAKHSNSAGNILDPIARPAALIVGRKPPASAPSTPSHQYHNNHNNHKSTHFDFEQEYDHPHDHDNEDEEEEDTVIKHYVELQKRLSDELHAAIKNDDHSSHSHGYGKKHGDAEGLSEDFKKRLQQWDMWKASSGKYNFTDEELQRIIPSDFSKKLQEWENIKISKASSDKQLPTTILQPVPPVQQRKKKKSIPTDNISTDEIRRQKEIAWLDKQLEKIETEKRRLEKELKKYCEREARLEKMREALKNSLIGESSKNSELWIRTPTAQCKVEGIDEKFITKKLFKWEEKQGIQPESSTIALLSPKYITTSSGAAANPSFGFGNCFEQGVQNQEQAEELSKPNEMDSPAPCPAEFDHEDLGLQLDSQNDTNSSTLKSTDTVAAPHNDEEADAFTESESEDEYTEDSFATNKDERTSGASNTDSECYNLLLHNNKQQNSSSGASGTSCAGCGYRRRSSDAISTPLSTTRSPSLSGCTSDDEENFMLKTVNESEETQVQGPSIAISSPKAPILMAKQIQLLDAEDTATTSASAPIIVKTNRTIFSPVTLHDITPDFDLDEPQPNVEFEPSAFGLKSPGLVSKTLKSKFPDSGSSPTEASSPPKIVGAIRKAPIALVSPHNYDNTTKFQGKTGLWCSPLLTRKKEPKSTAPIMDKYTPFSSLGQTQDFSIDRFLQDTNLIPETPAPVPQVCPSGLPKLPIVSRLPQHMPIRKKYTLNEPSLENTNAAASGGSVRLLTITRSNSFQGSQPTHSHNSQIVRNIPIELESASSASSNLASAAATVTKSKSTSSILLGKLGLKSSESKDSTKNQSQQQPCTSASKILWFRSSSNNNNNNSKQ